MRLSWHCCCLKFVVHFAIFFWGAIHSAFADSIESLSEFASHADPSVEIRALETLVDSRLATPEQINQGWASDEQYVRERLASALYRTESIAGLQLGWKASITDQERCRLALRLSVAGERDAMVKAASADSNTGPAWPVFSQGTLEDKWTCALAASRLLSLDAPLDTILERGDFPLSMPFVWDVYTFSTADNRSKLVSQMEWVEEGLRAPLWTALWLSAVQDEVQTEGDVNVQYREQIDAWSVGECLDAVEFSWMVGARDVDVKDEVLETLSWLKTHSPLCKEWAQLAQSSLRRKLPKRILKQATDIRGQKDDVLAALRLVTERDDFSKREKRKLKRFLSPLLKEELDTPLQIELLRGLQLWNHPDDTSFLTWLDDFERSVLDPTILVEIAILRFHLEQKDSK